jgi:hypothetical protein
MARPNVFGLVFKIDASDQKKFGQIQKQVNSLSSSMNKNLGGSFLNLKNLATGFFGVMAASKVASEIKEFATEGDRLAKTSKVIGVTIGTLQELEYVAGQAGASAGSVTSAYENMNKSLGQAKSGTGRLNTFLQKSNSQLLGQVKNAKSSEEAFDLLANALANETDVSKRQALATAAFGGAASDMIKFTSGGADSINQLREAKRRYGLMSDEAAKESERFNDNMDNLSQATKGLAFTALGPLLPKLADMFASLSELVVANKDVIASALDTFFTVLQVAVSVVVTLFDTGLIPALGGAYLAFVALRTIVLTSQAVWAAYTVLQTAASGSTLLMLKSWLALNAAFLMSPIGLIIAGIIALVAVGYLIYKNWDSIVKIAMELWEWIKKLAAIVWDNLVQAFEYLKSLGLFDPIILGIKSVMALWNAAKSILPSWLGGDNEPSEPPSMPGVNGGSGSGNAPTSRNQGVINSNTTTTNRSELDVNFNNLPSGTSTRRRGSAPGITVQRGVGASR